MNGILLLAGCLLCQASGPSVETQQEWLRRSQLTRPTTFPTGVIATKIPARPNVVAHGPEAQAFVARAFAAPQSDPTIPDRRDYPWLVLIGPDDATKQAEQAIPEDVAPKVKVTRHEMTALNIRRFGLKRAYGTQALVMAPDGSIEYEGLFELKPVVDALRRLLGIEPEPDPDDGGWLPNPFRPRPLISISWGAFWLGLFIGLAAAFIIPTVARVTVRTVVASFKGAIRAAVDEAQRPNQ